MSRNSSRLLLTAWLAIAGSPLLAAPSPRTAAPRASSGVEAVAVLPNPLTQLWHRLTSLWEAAGCGLDPNGAKCSSTTVPPATVTAPKPADLGCSIEPNGLQ